MISKRLLSLCFLLAVPEKITCLALASPDKNNPRLSPGATKSNNYIVSTSKSGGRSRYFFLDKASSPPPQPSSRSRNSDNNTSRGRRTSRLADAIGGLTAAFRATFLPSGYPTKTPPGYLKYCEWGWVQDLSTQLRSVLATQRVLEGVGFGREGATAVSALMNYLVRDGCGMAATLLFTSAASAEFRCDVKRWRLFADLMVDLGITLEVVAVLLPTALFLPAICLGNMCKAVCGVAAGACNGSINVFWARGSDISDINAKEGAQRTVTGALGLVFSALFVRSMSSVGQPVLWVLYSALTLLHVFANVQCMRLIAFDSLSTTRMNVVLSEFIAWFESLSSCNEVPSTDDREEDGSSATTPTFSTPKLLARTEPLFFWTGRFHKRPRHGIPIRFGIDYNQFLERSNKCISEVSLKEDFEMNKTNYVVASGAEKKGRATCVLVSLFAGASPKDEAKAYFHANMLALRLKKNNEDHGTDNKHLISSSAKLEKEVKACVDRYWPIFEKTCTSTGWDLGKTVLRGFGYEVRHVCNPENSLQNYN